MSEPNALLRAARERVPSPRAPGEPMSRAELADAVNAWLWESTRIRYELDHRLVGKWERGVVGLPISPYRAALRALLRVGTDADLGFGAPLADPRPTSTSADVGPWSRSAIAEDASSAAERDLAVRGSALRGGSAVCGAGPITDVAPWLEPLADAPLSTRRGAFAAAEVEAVESIAASFREWRTVGTGLGRTAVVGQVSDIAERLRDAPEGALTDRMFLAGAELAKVGASMAFDDGLHVVAQKHYVTAVRMAKAGGSSSFGAVVLAAIARQSFDVGAAEMGLRIVLMAQRGTHGIATPALRSMLATREAWGHAQRGTVYAFQQAVDTAEQSLTDSDPSTEPRWLRGFDQAELAGTIGSRYRDLARFDPRQAHRAVPYLDRAIAQRDPARTRNRAFDLVSLARTHLVTGEHECSAVSVGAALSFVDVRRPGRLVRKLVEWRREAAPFDATPTIGACRAAIADLCLRSSTS